jgi:uncharacterized membrane protein
MVYFHGSSYQRDQDNHDHRHSHGQLHMRTTSRRNQFHSKIQQENKPRDRKARRRGRFNIKLWVKSTWEVLTTSLFFAPVLAVIFGVVLGILCSYVDAALSQSDNPNPPVIWMTTTSSAQSLLSTVAGATISFAGTAFSVSLLVIQLASTTYSPRVVHTLFKDPFNRRIVALVVGTFTYCLVVMRSLGDKQEEEGDAVLPNVSVAVAFLLGIASVLAIVAFIDHAANTMDISQLLERIIRDTVYHIQRTWELDDNKCGEKEHESKSQRRDDISTLQPRNTDGGDAQQQQSSANGTDEYWNGNNQDNPKTPKSKKGEEAEAEISTESHVVRFRSSGWIQEIDFDAVSQMVPENASMKVHTVAGRYAIPGTALCSISPKPTIHNCKHVMGENDNSGGRDSDDEEEDWFLDQYDSCVLDSIMVGPSRTIRCDPSFGLRQLVDIIIRALSPGINDPTTAQDGIFHVTAVVTEFCHRKIPESIRRNEHEGKLILNEQHDYDSLVRLAFDEVRTCASSNPTVALYILESLRLIRESLQAGGFPHRAPEIERQARLIEECIRHDAANIHDDHETIVQARQDRFSTDILAERNTNDMFA